MSNYDRDNWADFDNVQPLCDICDLPQEREGDDWNGDTGNHFSCENLTELEILTPALGHGNTQGRNKVMSIINKWQPVPYGKARVRDIDYHRNGSGNGEGYVVALVDYINNDNPTPDQQLFVVTSVFAPVFTDLPKKYKTREFAIERFMAQTSAVEITNGVDVKQGWRSADMFGPLMVKAWSERCADENRYGYVWAAAYDPFADEQGSLVEGWA